MVKILKITVNRHTNAKVIKLYLLHSFGGEIYKYKDIQLSQDKTALGHSQ
jgi:hypothetical protein